MQKKILVTGGQGNLGKSLIHQHSGISYSLTRDNWQDMPRFIDLGVDTIIHCASDLKTRLEEHPEKVLDSNLMSTARILEVCKLHQISQFIFISSCAVYGDSVETGEETPCLPLTFNGQIKHLNEQLVRKFCTHNKISFKIFRAFNTYGGEDHFSVLHHLKEAILKNHAFRLNNKGISKRDFIHVQDIAAIILKLISKDYPYDTLNIGTGKVTSILEVLRAAKVHFPDIKIQESETAEAEFSKANTERLKEILDYDFLPVLEYVQKEWGQEVLKAKSLRS